MIAHHISPKAPSNSGMSHVSGYAGHVPGLKVGVVVPGSSVWNVESVFDVNVVSCARKTDYVIAVFYLVN